MNERTITLILTSPTRGETKISCDSVRFSVPDGETNRNAGGSVGIRRGHAYALMAVAEGRVCAFLDGKPVFSCAVGAGLAVVGDDSVSILTDRYEERDDQDAQ